MKCIPTSPWLDPAEQEEIIRELLRYRLIRFSNERALPLKSGGKTDIYINLRDARNTPTAISLITGLFEHPLRRLGVKRFAEVPDSVSCFAGPLSISTNLPYITLREKPKEGRVAKATMIGEVQFEEDLAIIDDVITDGASKEAPYWECVSAGVSPKALVVLVDRQQGWQKKFAEKNINLPVWAGMTLHDVRKILIQSLGVMERCNVAIEEKNPIIVALDGKSWEEVLPLVDDPRELQAPSD